MTDSLHWHLFCRVVDNFGDIGVCWRLSRQLCHQQGQQISLWVDDLHSFAAIEPRVNPALTQQQVDGIQLYHWQEPLPLPPQAADVVVETFACDLPPVYLAAMQARHQRTGQQPVWINLEYLSAEDWVRDCHGCPSPVHGLNKSFFFPGFSPGTGGLLFDVQLPELSRTLAEPAARAAFLASLGVTQVPPGSWLISLFAYENPALPAWLEQLSQGSQPVLLLVPDGRISAGVADWLGQPLQPGQAHTRASLTLQAVPFMAQQQYDALLACCDLNFVRGEESFVRAQMLGKPMVWHIYRQDDDAHLEKLEAFLQRYLQQAPAALRQPLLALFRGWNQPGQPLPPLAALQAQFPHWQTLASEWQQSLLALGDLASNLVQYVRNRV